MASDCVSLKLLAYSRSAEIWDGTYRPGVWSDATAAIGIARQKGLGKTRHLDVTDLWIQDQIRDGKITLDKVWGTDNPSDVLTTSVDRSTMQKAVQGMNLVPTDGRPASAPQAMGV